MIEFMKKNIRNTVCMLATAISAISMAACSSDEETDKSATFHGQQDEPRLCIYAAMPTETRGAGGALFTEDDIEWFNVSTRELRFRNTMEPLRDRLQVLGSIDFYLDGEMLFTGGVTFVSLICSQVFHDLVLCCGKIDGNTIDMNHYYLNDSYPDFVNDEQVQANRSRRAPQWEKFIGYLKSQGKLR